MADIKELTDAALNALKEQALGFGEDAAEVAAYLPLIAGLAAKYGAYAASPDPILKAEAENVLQHLNAQLEMIAGILAAKGKQRIAELVNAASLTAGRIIKNLIMAGVMTP